MTEWIEGAIAAFESLGTAGYVFFVAAYIVGGLLLLPEAAFTIAAGAMYGTFWGTLIARGSATVTATLIASIALTVFLGRIAKKRLEIDG